MSRPSVDAFLETAVLQAVLAEDEQEAQHLVAYMEPSERAAFARQLDTLRGMLTGPFGNDRGPIT